MNNGKIVDGNDPVWDLPYRADAHFYKRKDGTVFGAFALTEGTDTVFPVDPRNTILSHGKRVEEWKMLILSTTKHTVIGELEYYETIKRLKLYTLRSSGNDKIMISGLPLSILESLLE